MAFVPSPDSEAQEALIENLASTHLSPNINTGIAQTIIMPEPKRIAQIVRIKRSSIPAYKECHAAVWPAVLKQIKDCNISDYSIFLDEEALILYATMKYTGEDFEKDMQKMRGNPEVRRWWVMTDGMQESLVEGSEGSTDAKGWWRDLEEVFRVE